MDEPVDMDGASVLKKHRLMAAALPAHAGESSGVACRPGRTGVSLIYCFVCGGGVTPGKELQLQIKFRNGSTPFFPFLHGQEPAPGAADVGTDGNALVCAVCYYFLREQWNAFERSRTPIEKRVYWLKRPHQCDTRRTPGDWNGVPDSDPQPSMSGQGDADESDFSAYSDNNNVSDQDSDAGAAKGKSFKVDPVAAGMKSTDAHRDLVYRAGHRIESETSVLPNTRVIKHLSQCSLAPFRIEAPVENKRMDWNPHISDSKVRSYDSDASDGNEINVTTSDEESQNESRRQKRTIKRHVCYICGCTLTPGTCFEVHVQKQERAAREPFFPFLWLHTPPTGAMPISPGGCTLICTSCHTSLMQQWQGFELADVPILQRLYVVPLNTAGTTVMSHSSSVSEQVKRVSKKHSPKVHHPSSSLSRAQCARESCYLCGQDCGRDVRVAYSHAGAGKSRGTMYFPFISLLPCPPDARGNQEGQVHCCATCYTILEDIWAAYRLCLREELITSVSTFLGRYHQTASSGGFSGKLMRSLEGISSSVHHISVCYLCGAELSAGTECQLHVNPPGRCGEKEPFFPFLTVHTPAPRARHADATGLVAACCLCYHDLLAQYAQHEATGSGPSSSPWSRQYNCESFVCFFCRQEKKRALGLKAVCVARLPVFLYAPRVSHTLVVDDGKQLTIGSCMECKSMVLAGQNIKQDGILDSGRPAVAKQKVRLCRLAFFHQHLLVVMFTTVIIFLGIINITCSLI